MAIEQPTATDPLNAPDHSLQHRIIASDASAPVKSLTIDASGDIGGDCFQNTNPTNLLSNGDFEAWSAGTSAAPDGWTLSGASAAVARESSTIKLGTYAVSATNNAGAVLELYQYVHASKGIDYWKGRTITFGVWVKTDTASRVRIYCNGYSGYHTGDDTWQLLTVTNTIAAEATGVQADLIIDSGTSITAYFDGAMVVEGSSAFAFSDKPAGEGVWTDYFATSTIVGWAASPTGYIRTKKIGNTIFCSFWVTGTSNEATTTFTIPYETLDASVYCPCYANDATGLITAAASGHTVRVYATMAGGAFAASGSKNVRGQFFFEEE